MNRRIRIAQIGIGHNHASEKMRTVRAFPELYEVVGLCEPDPAWRAARGTLDVYQGLPWLDEEALFNTPGLDAVMVETDVWHLTPVARRCIDRGLHVHMGKVGGNGGGLRPRWRQRVCAALGRDFHAMDRAFRPLPITEKGRWHLPPAISLSLNARAVDARCELT